MYCGDETGSFIGEIGSHTSRFGYGGEDNPKLVVPSFTITEERNTSNSSGDNKKRRMWTSSLQSPSQTREERMESILRMASSSNENESDTVEWSKIFPQTNPDAFLRQGDSVENWDSLQTAWETSMVTLRATDTQKHTVGGNPYIPKGTSTTKSSSTVKSTPLEGKCIHPLLAITPGITHFEGVGKDYMAAYKRQQYAQYTEIFMEALDATSMFLAPAPMLASFSLGRQTALIVDVGAGGCRATPIVDGLVLQQSQRRNGRGGDWLGNITWKALLNEYDVAPTPRYLLRNATVNQKESNKVQSLWYRQSMNDLMYEVRTQPFVTVQSNDSPKIRVPFLKTKHASSPSPPGSPDSVTRSGASYELPDGTSVDLTSSFGRDLQQLPELLFSDTLPFAESKDVQSMPSTFSTSPLHQLVKESLLAVGDVDARKELTGSICLVGASSLFPNLDTRLSQELSNLLPSFVKPKVVASRISVERSCAAWIGGSILTSLGSFQQLWLSRTEYEEYGTGMAIQRFP
ncbi:actin related protein [Nitzschia inconspicua]|uniref:Actin related protein n=1 Tax=Nitzschia inconspicua TaxID=303405 RepID=A0A9K3LMX1_9STRA|nr:actin related protein [Nitzschia inconspicua]